MWATGCRNHVSDFDALARVVPFFFFFFGATPELWCSLACLADRRDGRAATECAPSPTLMSRLSSEYDQLLQACKLQAQETTVNLVDHHECCSCRLFFFPPVRT